MRTRYRNNKAWLSLGVIFIVLLTYAILQNDPLSLFISTNKTIKDSISTEGENRSKAALPSIHPTIQNADSTVRNIAPQKDSPTPSQASKLEAQSTNEEARLLVPSRANQVTENNFVTEEQIGELVAHTWAGGGFKPPTTPDFDELFRNQRKRTGFTYSELSLKDGVYLVDFAESVKAKPLIFQASLKQTTYNNRTGFLAEWLQWKGSPRVGLTNFSSAYVDREIYYGFLNLPATIFADQGYPLQNCPEVLVIRHFDYAFESSHQSFVTFFNSRAYCRTDVDQLRFIGRMGFQFLKP